MLTKSVSVLAVLALLATGCGNQDAPSSPPSAPPTAPSRAEAAPAPSPSEPSATAGDPTFDLRLVAPASAQMGEGAPVRVELAAKGGYHVNQEYPIRVNFNVPPGVTLAKAQFQRPDAAEFGETSARFETTATAITAGTHRIVAEVDFAVCSDQNCIPDRRTLAADLTVR